MSARKDESRQQGGKQGGSEQGGSGIHSNFAHASADSNVNAPGQPQSGAGSVGGQASDQVPGGVTSQIEASRNAQAAGGGSAAGRNSGPTPEDGPADDGHSVVNSSGGAGMDRDS